MAVRAWLMGAVLMGCGSLVAAAEGGTVEADGQAPIRGGDKSAAKTAAVADALKHCVEKVVGITIKTEFSSSEQETVTNNADEFAQKVQNVIQQKSEGFIQHYDLLSEKVNGDSYQVSVRATVFTSQVEAEVKKLADLIAAAGNPKLMLVVQEVYIEPDGSQHVAAESIMASYLEKELLARGFELRGQNAARQLSGASAPAFDAWMSSSSACAQSARNEGADVVIYGRVQIKNQGEIQDTGGIDALKGQVRIEISSVVHGINATSGEVFSSNPVQMKSMGISEERAVHRALKGTGANLVKQVFGSLLDDLKTSCRKAADQGQQYVVSLVGVTSYRRQGQTFLELLKAINGVSSVAEKAFDGGHGSMDVDVMCKCSTAELQQRIFSATEHAETLHSLDLAGVSGKKLSFKL